MTWTEAGRWTCPHASCGNTFTCYGSEHDTAAAIQAVQQRHGKAHREAAVLSARLRKTNVDRPAPHWGAA